MIEPGLSHVSTFSVRVGEPVVIGRVAEGLRRVVPILGGRAHGPRLRGEILPLGADFQVLRDDHSARLEARYALRTDDDATIGITNLGLRHGPADLVAKVARGEVVDPALMYFRTVFSFETDHPDYLWLTKAIFLGSGERHPDRVEIAVYEVL